jgi:outer membrane usher protein
VNGGETAFAIGYDGEAYLTGLSPSNTVQIRKPDGLSCNASFDFAPDANGQVRIPGVVCLSTDMKLAAETGGVTVKAKR